MQKIVDIDYPIVSVIINCFNGEKYLREAIESVIAQTYTNWEIILWDNCSTDHSAEIFKSYSDKRFKYYLAEQHTNLGHARNLATQNSNGDWIAFLDCDDKWLPTKLQEQINFIKKSSEKLGFVYCDNLILCNNRLVNGSYKSVLGDKTNDIYNQLIFNNHIALVSVLFNINAIYEVGGIDENLSYAEDFDLLLKISKKYKTAYVKKKLSVYRIHDTNLSVTKRRIGFEESIKIISAQVPSANTKKALVYNYNRYALYLMFNKEKEGFELLKKYLSIKYMIRIIYEGIIRTFQKLLF